MATHSQKRGLLPRRRGSIVLEAALILPILLLIVFGTIEFGYAFYIKHSLQGAAREGARVGVLSGSTTQDIQDAVSQAMTASGLADASYTVRVGDASGSSVDPAALSAGDPLLVEVAAPWGQFSVFMNSFNGWIGGNLTGRTVMRKEQ